MKRFRSFVEPSPQHDANMKKLMFIIDNQLINLDGKWVAVKTNISSEAAAMRDDKEK